MPLRLSLFACPSAFLLLSACAPDPFSTGPEVRGLSGPTAPAPARGEAVPEQFLLDPADGASVSLGGAQRLVIDLPGPRGSWRPAIMPRGLVEQPVDAERVGGDRLVFKAEAVNAPAELVLLSAGGERRKLRIRP